MKTFKVTQEQIEEAHSAACDSWKQKLKEWFPDAFKEEFKVGDWVKTDCFDSLFYITDIQGSDAVGYGFENGQWLNTGQYYWSLSEPIRKATREEVKEALFKEAERRYGKSWKRVKIKKSPEGSDFVNNNGVFTACYSGRVLWSNNGVIFSGGEWAEPLEELTCSQKVTWGEDYTFSELPPKVNTSELEQRVASIEKTLKRIEDKL